MKTTKILLVALVLLLCKTSYCDIIPGNTHLVDKCVKITNIDDFNEISLLGYVLYVGVNHESTYLISSAECLTKGYKFNKLEIFAIDKKFIENQDIQTIDLPNEKNAFISNFQIDPYAGYYDNSNPISAIEQYYKIMGFTDNTIVLHKWKEVIKFNNGSPYSTTTFKFEGDSLSISHEIPTGIITPKVGSGINVFPNPAGSYFNLQANNDISGEIEAIIYTTDGRIIKSFSFDKTNMASNFVVQTTDLLKGCYFIKTQFGKYSETKKIIIK